MVVRVGSIVMGASDVRRAMEFWGRALGYVPREEPEDTWVVLTPASGNGPNIVPRVAVADALRGGRARHR